MLKCLNMFAKPCRPIPTVGVRGMSHPQTEILLANHKICHICRQVYFILFYELKLFKESCFLFYFSFQVFIKRYFIYV